MKAALAGLEDLQKKAKRISTQYALYKESKSVHASRGAQGASRGARRAQEDQVIEMHYSNVEELERDKTRLQPTTDLDHKMRGHQSLIERYIKDGPQNDFLTFIKGKVDYVLEVHKAEGMGTNIFTASRILAACMPVFQKTQFSAKPSPAVDLNLDGFLYEEEFRRVVQSLIDGTPADYKGCLKQIACAIDKCEEQLSKVVGRYSEEENSDIREGMVQSQAEVKKIAIKEQTDLTAIQKKCDDDIAEIESTSVSLEGELTLTTTAFNEAESTLLRKHEELRTKEHEFQPCGANSQSRMEEIQRLRREDIASRTEKPKRKKVLMETQEAVSKATSELCEWGKEITDLKSRVPASLDILEDMQGCANMIFDKAETQRKEWQKKLALMKIDCLKAQNDPLMAQGLIYQLMTQDCECNIERCKQRQNKLEGKWRRAVRYSDKTEQERLQDKLQQCQDDAREYTKIYRENKSRQDGHVARMITIQGQLNEIVTASQVTEERIDCEPEEKLRQKFAALQVRMEAAFEHRSTANLHLITN